MGLSLLCWICSNHTSQRYPSSNGLAERFVWTFKPTRQARWADATASPGQFPSLISTTGVAPCTLFLGRNFRTSWSQICKVVSPESRLSSEQTLGMWPTTTPHFRTATTLGSLASSSSISTGSFSPTQGSILVCKIWWAWLAIFSSSLCYHTSHTVLVDRNNQIRS